MHTQQIVACQAASSSHKFALLCHIRWSSHPSARISHASLFSNIDCTSVAWSCCADSMALWQKTAVTSERAVDIIYINFNNYQKTIYILYRVSRNTHSQTGAKLFLCPLAVVGDDYCGPCDNCHDRCLRVRSRCFLSGCHSCICCCFSGCWDILSSTSEWVYESAKHTWWRIGYR